MYQRPAMPLQTLLILLGLAVALPATAAKGYHLYYDENGQAVYSQFAPGEGKESTVVKPPPPPAESPEVAQERLREQIQRLEDAREDQELAREKAAKEMADSKAAADRCSKARSNLAAFEGQARRLFRQPDGSFSRLTDEERQTKRAEMEKIIENDCR